MLDGLISGLLALAALVAATGGVEVDFGPLTLRSHSAARVLAIALIPLGFRVWMWRQECRVRLPPSREALRRTRRSLGVGGQPDHSVALRIALLTLIFLSIGYWFKYLLTSVGGADSYGYASAARLLASGRLVDSAPIADWLSPADRLALTSPLGWAPWAGGDGIVPKYPLGLPVLMALFSSIGGSEAIYLVSPAMGLLTLWLVFRFTLRWTDETPRLAGDRVGSGQATALLATALVAWNPVFLTYAKQPMSDVPATAWLMLALYLAAYGPANRLRPDSALRASSRSRRSASREGGQGYGGQEAGRHINDVAADDVASGFSRSHADDVASGFSRSHTDDVASGFSRSHTDDVASGFSRSHTDDVASGFSRSFFAGVAAGAAFLTRPALAFAVALVPLLAVRDPAPYRRMFLSGLGVAVAAIVQIALQGYLFGNPMATGYGPGQALFSWPALPQNVEIYARQSWLALGWWWLLALGAGAWAMRGPRATAILAVAAAVALPYLFYIPFDHWETLRFLLPGLVPLSILAAAGVTRLAEPIRVPVAAGIIVVLFAGAFAARSERLMRESSVWTIQDLEARYPLAGQWFQVNTPPQSVALAHQHSGSLRWYSGKQTLRWDLMEPEELVGTVRELEAHGATVYAALEGSEQQAFNAKFSVELARLSVDPVGRVRNISFLRLRSP